MYKVKTQGKSFGEIVNEIGLSNNMLIKGGKVDARRVYLKLINDWQKGKHTLER
jgi:ribosome biogenesis GTPase A